MDSSGLLSSEKELTMSTLKGARKTTHIRVSAERIPLITPFPAAKAIVFTRLLSSHSLTNPHAHTHARTHARTHTRTHNRTNGTLDSWSGKRLYNGSSLSRPPLIRKIG